MPALIGRTIGIVGGFGGLGGLGGLGRSRAVRSDTAAVRTTFADVAGIDEARDELVEIVDFLRSPERFRALGARPPEVGEPVEAYGKAALVGLDGEVEHGSAIIHNLLFGNRFRDPAGGTELLPAAEKVGAYGSAIDIPLKHKLDAKTRSHHQTFTFRVDDAPLPREILVACIASNAGRPLARLATFGSEVAK